MDLEDHFPATDIRQIDYDLPVEPARPEQCRIENVGPVGGRNQNHSFIRLKPIHLDQELVESLLALVMAATKTRSPMPSHGIDLVNEDDTRSVGLTLLEQVTHPRGADTHEHLDEIRTGHGEERTGCLTCHRPCQQRLPGSGSPDEQNAFGKPASQTLETLWILEELDYLLQLRLGLVRPGHFREGRFGCITGQQLGLRAPELERAVASLLHLTEEEDPQTDQDDPRQQVQEDRAE